MTAEVAILNKTAVALAADSAVTMRRGGGTKIYNTDKLFMLSKHYPIGIMVYGEAEFLLIPWETTIKTFRKMLGKKPFSSVKEYAEYFIDYLAKTPSLFKRELQELHFREILLHRFYLLDEETRNEMRKARAQGKTIVHGDKLSEIIKDELETWEQAKDLPNASEKFRETIIDQYGGMIQESVKDIFGILSKEISDNLMRLASYYSSKLKFRDLYSGIVVAGFGESEVWPSLWSYKIDGMILDTLKYEKGEGATIGVKSNSAIFPFARGDVVFSFIEGVDPIYMQFTESYVAELLTKYHETLNIKKEDGDKVIEDLRGKLEEYRWMKHVKPILDALEGLPKDELATLAESLVYLTSLKLKYSFEFETVGGPIDVALISKGDGFIWVKRKHYFKPELNPQFFANKYGKP